MTTTSSIRRAVGFCAVLACTALFSQLSLSQIIGFWPPADSIVLACGGDIPPGLWYSVDTTAKPVDSIRIFGYLYLYRDVIDSTHAIPSCAFAVANANRNYQYELLYLPDPSLSSPQIVVKRDTFTIAWPYSGDLLLVVSDSHVPIDSMKIRLVIRILVGVERHTAAPTQSALMQNFPNPFNGQTTIRYNMPAADIVLFDLFNVNGQRIRGYPQGRQAAGEHSLKLSLGDLPSGTYFVRLSTSSQIRTIALSLIR